jgi:hypothetical protein
MPHPDSPKTARTLGQLVEVALATRNQWRRKHTAEAHGDEKLTEQWEETKQFWRPWFRGHKDADWQLRPKLYRAGEPDVNKLFRFEEELRGEFKRRGWQLAPGFTLPANKDEWGWYGLMQHYGAPTRLLDWSDGALTGLYFALRDTEKEDKGHPCNKPPDACVWMLDPYRLNLVSFHPSDESFGVALPDWETADQYLPELFVGEKLQREYPLAIDPPHLFQRLSSQRGHFTVFGTRPDGLYELGQQNNCLIEKITIPEHSIQQIRSELELSGISEATIFPDLEALSRELESVWESHFGPTRFIPGNA